MQHITPLLISTIITTRHNTATRNITLRNMILHNTTQINST